MQIKNDDLAKLVKEYEVTKNPNLKTEMALLVTKMAGLGDSALIRRAAILISEE